MAKRGGQKPPHFLLGGFMGLEGFLGLASLVMSGASMANANKQAKRAEQNSRAMTQLQLNRAPATSTKDPLSASIKKYGNSKGIKGNILNNSRQPVAANNNTSAVGGNTLLGQ